MNDFYLCLNSRDSSGICKKNSPSEYWIQFPKHYILKGKWMCELIDITLDCNFKQRSSRLYLCSDIVAESYVRGSLNELLRNIEIGRRYKKTKLKSYLRPIYLPAEVSMLDSIRIELKDKNVNSIDFNSTTCIASYISKEMMGTREVYDFKLQKWIPYISDPNKWYQHLLDVRDGYGERDSQGRYMVGSGQKYRRTLVTGTRLSLTPGIT